MVNLIHDKYSRKMKKAVTLILTIVPLALYSQTTSSSIDIWNSTLLTAMMGGIIGGIIGVIGTLWTSYYGPKKLIEFNDKRDEMRLNGPRKTLLLKLLEDKEFPDGRTIETLSMVTGTSVEDCRRLLVEIGARGIKHEGDVEGWVLIKNKPIKED